MSRLTRYDTIEEMKANARPLDPTSPQSQERHDRFERFINSLKSCEVVVASSSREQNDASVSTEVVYGL